MNIINYKNKYLKYKSKYRELKQSSENIEFEIKECKKANLINLEHNDKLYIANRDNEKLKLYYPLKTLNYSSKIKNNIYECKYYNQFLNKNKNFYTNYNSNFVNYIENLPYVNNNNSNLKLCFEEELLRDIKQDQKKELLILHHFLYLKIVLSLK